MEILIARSIVVVLALVAALVAAYVANRLRESTDDSFIGFVGFMGCLGAIPAALYIAYHAMTVPI